uniref:Reverse transcriptase Ty1/copia-type domain-containing protein n=1 Tax=Aegilops tauschii subsp. strangulata TaxID=200361 RepID=A0A453IDZ6_AEGTS
PMTRSQAGTLRPSTRYPSDEYLLAASVSEPSPLPSSARAALRDPHWLAAMQEEFDALQRNRTWQLVPRPPRANIITGKWVFRHKTRPDGTLERYKARWVVRGFRQRAGVDFTDTFAPVVKPGTIRTVLQLAVSRTWHVHQLDVSNAFLHGHLAEQVFCEQPTGFVDATHPDHVCLLSRSLYGLKQAPRAWYQRIATFLQTLGFTSTRSDASLFVYHHGVDTAYLLLYVDDIILTASTVALLQRLTAHLCDEFALKDLGPLHYFLGIEVVRRPDGFFLHQQRYAHELLDRAGMLNCKPAPTPVDTKAKVSALEGSPASDAAFYRSIVGALQYLTLTRPDLQYAVQQACLHMHALCDSRWTLVKRILRYIRGTQSLGLTLTASASTDLVAYSDADWAGCPDTRRSTSGYCVYLGPSLISWSSKRQPTVSRSSAEAEYRAVANAVAECSWLRQPLQELLCDVHKATLVYCDNVSIVYLSANPVHHRRTKHIELDIHFVCEQVALGRIRVLHVSTAQQFADVMTKGLLTSVFEEFRSSLCVSGDASTAGGC